jgi:hypothetical protein
LGRWRIFTTKRRGVILDRGGFVDRLEGIRELEEELCGLWEVLDLGGLGWQRAGLGGGELRSEAVSEEFMYEGGYFRAKETDQEEGADFYATI